LQFHFTKLHKKYVDIKILCWHLTQLTTKATIFLDVTLCSPIDSYGPFREPAASIINIDAYRDDKCLYISIRI